MAAIASAERIAELERSVRACPARTAGMLRRAADLLSATSIRDFALKFQPDVPIAEAG